MASIQQECSILRRLHHNGIIKLYDVYRMDQSTYGLVTELVKGQSLDCVIHK